MPMPIVQATPQTIADAGAVLRQGGLVAFPTETVYGLGADARQDQAVCSIFTAKNRPAFNPLILHVADIDQAREWVEMDERALAVAQAFWPGPLTLVLTKKAGCRLSARISAGLNSVAIRIPNHPVALAVIRAAGCPIAAPSANRSGHISPTTALHVVRSLGAQVDLVLDGGSTAVGVESTILDLTEAVPVLLRPGGIPRERLEAMIGPCADPDTKIAETAPKAPGQLSSHYAPHLPLRMNAQSALSGEAFIAFGPTDCPHVATLSASGDLEEAARKLFAILHEFDNPLYTGIAVMPIPEYGLGVAINDRLRRAAAPRPQRSKPDDMP